MNKELQKIISKECMNLGLNTAHDFDGIETEEDLVIYTKAIIKKYKSLINKPVETTNEQPRIDLDGWFEGLEKGTVYNRPIGKYLGTELKTKVIQLEGVELVLFEDKTYDLSDTTGG